MGQIRLLFRLMAAHRGAGSSQGAPQTRKTLIIRHFSADADQPLSLNHPHESAKRQSCVILAAMSGRRAEGWQRHLWSDVSLLLALPKVFAAAAISLFGGCRRLSGNSGESWRGSHREASLGGSVCAGAVLPMLGMALAGLMLLAPAFGQTLTLTGVTTVTVSTDVPIPYGVRPYSKVEGEGILLKKGGGILNLIDVVNSSKGTIRLQEGGLFIQKDEALGYNKAILHFLGGTLSFLAFGAPITLGGTRHIILENSGTFFAPFGGFAAVHVHSKLSGSGELRKLGINDLNFEQIDAGKFTGTIRLAEGGLVIGADNNLGSTVDGSALVFSGGTVHFSAPSGPSISIVLGKNRLITIEAGAKGNFNTRGGAVAVRSTLSGSGELRKTGVGLLDFNGINADMFTGTFRLEEGGLLVGKDKNLGASANGLIFSGGTLHFAAPSDSSMSIVLGQKRLITIETGAKGNFNTRGGTVAVRSTLSGSGELRKTGVGLLDFRGIQATAFVGTIHIDAGNLLVEKDEDFGARTNGLIFSGGTVRFAAPSGPGTISLRDRLVTIGAGATGAFDTMGNTIVLHSTLSGSGELKKLGAGYLDFRSMTDVSGFAGTIRVEEGSLLIDDSRDLGEADGLIFSGGTLRFDYNSNQTLTMSQIVVDTEGTFHATLRHGGYRYINGISMESTLSGSGQLTKTGDGNMYLGGLDAAGFTGTLRIEEGRLRITNDKQLGDKSAKLILAGGELCVCDRALGAIGITVTLLKDRQIAVERNSYLYGNGVNVVAESAISTAHNATLTLSGRMVIRGQKKPIEDINLYIVGSALITVDTRSFAKEGKKQVYAANTSWLQDPKHPNFSFYQKKDTEGVLKGWTFLDLNTRGRYFDNLAIGKTGAGKLTVEDDNEFLETRCCVNYFIREGTMVHKNPKYVDFGRVRMRVSNSATLELYVEKGARRDSAGVYSGDGVFVKTGEGRFDIGIANFNLFNLEVREGTLAFWWYFDKSFDSFHQRKINPSVKFTGGTLRLLYDSDPLYTEYKVLKENVHIDVATSGTFDTSNNVVAVRSTLSGPGEFSKAGSGYLDFRSIADVSKFTGTIRMEAGNLLINDENDLGSASELHFSGGTLRIAGGAASSESWMQYTYEQPDPRSILNIGGGTVTVTLATNRKVSVDSGHKAFISFNNTVEIGKGFVDRVAKEATVQMIFQGSNARLTLGVDSDISITLRNWIFQGGEIPVIDVGTAMPSTSGMSMGADMTDKLVMKEAGFIGTSAFATVTMGTININRQVGIYSKVNPLDLRGWAANIAGRRMMLSLASISLTVSTGIKHHFGPRSLSGQGFLSKKGAGYLDMSHTDGSGFGGTVNIFGGTLKTGSLGKKSKMNVHSGATVQGGGKVGSVEVLDGGTLHHSSSVTLHVQGDYTQAGGTHRVHLRRNFAAITVDGTASLLKGTVTITAVEQIKMNDIYYLIRASSITMAGPVVSTVTIQVPKEMFVPITVTISDAPAVLYKKVTITVDQTSISMSHPFTLADDSNVFATIGMKNKGDKFYIEYDLKSDPMYYQYVNGRNGKQMAMALSQIDLRSLDGKPANYALLHITSADQARRALSSLSGEMHVSAGSALMSSGKMLEDAASGQMRMAFGKQTHASQRSLRTTMALSASALAEDANIGGGLGIWVQSLDVDEHYAGLDGVRSLSYSSSGSLMGFDLPMGNWRVGLFSGTSKGNFAQDAGQSTGSDEAYHAGMYAGRMWGKAVLHAGMSYSRHDISMNRKLHIPGLYNILSSRYSSHTYALFGQLDRSFYLSGVLLEPFVGLSHVRYTAGEFAERGVPGLEIHSDGQQDTVSMVSAGLGVLKGFRLGSMRMQARGMLSWKHELGSGEAVARQSLGASDSFDVYGVGREFDSLELEAGLDVRLNPGAKMSMTYSDLDMLDAGGADGYFRAVLEIAM